MKQLCIIFFLFTPILTMATHNRGGEITYTHLFGTTYEFTITTCTKTSSPADRPELEIQFGDGDLDTVERLSISLIPGYDAQKNIYVITHTYVGSGTFQICVSDPNRNGGIINIGGSLDSDNVAFSIQSQLVISPFLGAPNNSVTFGDCPCPEYACVNFAYCYNPEAIDSDGDSLGYELVVPLDDNCAPLFLGVNYTYPNTLGGGAISLNPATGDFCWNNPGLVGEFNIAIKITEYRNGNAIGYVIRDIQITVISGCDNVPPEITPLPDLCVVAGENISFNVLATDVDAGDNVTIEASGLPLSVSSSPAIFNSVTGPAPQTSIFSWNTNCSHIRFSDYQLFFTAEDNGLPELSSTQTMNISVIPPRITGLSASPLGNTVTLSWDPSDCATVCEGYNIYRSVGGSAIPNDPCCYNLDLSTYNYQLIGAVSGSGTTSFIDNTGLTIGNQYCYVVTSIFENNQLESCPSDSACTSLLQDVPIITHVSVLETDVSSGIDSIRWVNPTELDTLLVPGPYHYKVFHGTGFTGATTLVHTTSSVSSLSLLDTFFVHNSINTVTDANNYRVDLFATINGVPDSLVGGTNFASSVFLSTTPNDNRITLSWVEQVPWINSSFDVFRSETFSGPFVFLGSTTNDFYIDSNLYNGKEYCYYVESTGSYSVPGIVSPLLNLSQKTCDIPVDLTPPCSPTVSITPDCANELSTLVWNNPNNSCADDVTSYTIYYTDTIGGTYTAIGTTTSALDTTFEFSNNGSIAGCYYVTATDSIQYSNESDSGNVVCVDNCPIYFLPNVFTPNSDGQNDFFIPILPYKYIQDIDIQIFNRWGQVVYATTDPMIRWDGTVQESGGPAPDGVYYYVCIVNSIRLAGIVPIELSGVFHLFRTNSTGNGN
ncbi:MAG: T9SS type B sorting domain-containing protein [Crocinitomicaceae bacterium]|jgi:gliding motility-associated-like protein|nr:T9SS type B sorting domain-containing protein [Crocinitomicaceae bacterium]